MGPRNSINHYRQVMVMTVIGLVVVLHFLEKLCLSEKPGRIMTMVLMKGSVCIYATVINLDGEQKFDCK